MRLNLTSCQSVITRSHVSIVNIIPYSWTKDVMNEEMAKDALLPVE